MPFCTPTSSEWTLLLLHIWPAFGAVSALDFEHPKQRILGLMMIDSVNRVFTCVCVICTSFLGKHLWRYLAHFPIRLYNVSRLSLKCSLHIRGVITPYQTGIHKYFLSHGLAFIFLTASFAEKKLLILLKTIKTFLPWPLHLVLYLKVIAISKVIEVFS